jgi:hypothetical protein
VRQHDEGSHRHDDQADGWKYKMMGEYKSQAEAEAAMKTMKGC